MYGHGAENALHWLGRHEHHHLEHGKGKKVYGRQAVGTQRQYLIFAYLHYIAVLDLIVIEETGVLLSCSFDKTVIAWKYE